MVLFLLCLYSIKYILYYTNVYKLRYNTSIMLNVTNTQKSNVKNVTKTFAHVYKITSSSTLVNVILHVGTQNNTQDKTGVQKAVFEFVLDNGFKLEINKSDWWIVKNSPKN